MTNEKPITLEQSTQGLINLQTKLNSQKPDQELTFYGKIILTGAPQLQGSGFPTHSETSYEGQITILKKQSPTYAKAFIYDYVNAHIYEIKGTILFDPSVRPQYKATLQGYSNWNIVAGGLETEINSLGRAQSSSEEILTPQTTTTLRIEPSKPHSLDGEAKRGD